MTKILKFINKYVFEYTEVAITWNTIGRFLILRRATCIYWPISIGRGRTFWSALS